MLFWVPRWLALLRPVCVLMMWQQLETCLKCFSNQALAICAPLVVPRCLRVAERKQGRGRRRLSTAASLQFQRLELVLLDFVLVLSTSHDGC